MQVQGHRPINVVTGVDVVKVKSTSGTSFILFDEYTTPVESIPDLLGKESTTQNLELQMMQIADKMSKMSQQFLEQKQLNEQNTLRIEQQERKLKEQDVELKETKQENQDLKKILQLLSKNNEIFAERLKSQERLNESAENDKKQFKLIIDKLNTNNETLHQAYKGLLEENRALANSVTQLSGENRLQLGKVTELTQTVLAYQKKLEEKDRDLKKALHNFAFEQEEHEKTIKESAEQRLLRIIQESEVKVIKQEKTELLDHFKKSQSRIKELEDKIQMLNGERDEKQILELKEQLNKLRLENEQFVPKLLEIYSDLKGVEDEDVPGEMSPAQLLASISEGVNERLSFEKSHEKLAVMLIEAGYLAQNEEDIYSPEEVQIAYFNLINDNRANKDQVERVVRQHQLLSKEFTQKEKELKQKTSETINLQRINVGLYREKEALRKENEAQQQRIQALVQENALLKGQNTEKDQTIGNLTRSLQNTSNRLSKVVAHFGVNDRSKGMLNAVRCILTGGQSNQLNL